MRWWGRERQSKQLKKRLLSQAVAANVSDLSPGKRRPPRTRRRWPTVVATVVVAGSLVGLGWWRASWGGRPVAAVVAAPVVTPLVVPQAEELALPLAEPTYPTIGADTPRIRSASLPLGVRRVVLDPGHGGADYGAQAGDILAEKDVALDLALRVRERLVQSGIEVVMTRDADVAVPLRERAAIANRAEADLFLSIHLNWLDPSVAQRGIETYLLGATDDPRLEALAAAENAESGYSFADVRRLLDQIYLDLRQDSSQRLAQAVHQQLVLALRRGDPMLRDRGVKTAPFLVLVETGIPAILAEVGCLSHQRDAERFRDSTYRDRVADALAEGVQRYAQHPPAGGRRP